MTDGDDPQGQPEPPTPAPCSPRRIDDDVGRGRLDDPWIAL